MTKYMLLVTNEKKEEIDKVVKYAHDHPFTFDDLLDIFNGREIPPGERNNYGVRIPVGFRVVFSVEEQPQGWARHVSVSFNRGEMLPPYELCQELIKLFGFTTPLAKCICKEEGLSNGGKAMNIIEII